MGIKSTFGKGMTIASLIGTLVGVGGNPVQKGTTGGLSKQVSSYSKEVRLPQTRREITRAIKAATRTKIAGQKNSSRVSKSDVKRLK